MRKRARACARIHELAAVCFVGSIVMGCTTYGNVRVGGPEVFTREHLVNQRMRDHEWAYSQLRDSKNVDPTFAGLRDVSVFQGFANNLKLSLVPNPTKAKGGDGEAEDPTPPAESGDAKEPTPPAEGGSAATGGDGGGDVAADGEAGKADEHAEDGGKTSGAGLEIPKTLLRGSDAKVTTTKPDALQIFEYRSVVRGRINAALREAELDDTHDLRGSTLYTLQFPVTIMPGTSTGQFAGVELQVMPPGETESECQNRDTDTAERTRDYAAWLRNLQEQIQDEQIALQESLRDHTSLRQAAHLKSCASRQEFEADCGSGKPDIACVAAACIRRSYQRRLAYWWDDGQRDLVLANIDPPLPIGRRGSYVSQVTGNRETRRDFGTRLWFIGCNNANPPTLRVVGVEPKEYVQNVSEVAANETMLRMTAAVHALLPNGGGDLQDDAEYARKSQALLQSITNAPLVVGYSDSATTFGWLLGPTFTIKDAKAAFLHRPATRIVSADLSVPAWWPALRLSGTVFWLDRWGRRTHRQALWTDRGGVLQLDLPGDVRALATTLMSARVSERPRPSIQFVSPQFDCPVSRWEKGTAEKCVYLHATDSKARGKSAEQVVNLRGTDLWRSPEVYLGAQRADEVEVMSDMGGIIAHFRRVRMPGPNGASLVRVNLSVVTSVGEATLYRKAVIEK